MLNRVTLDVILLNPAAKSSLTLIQVVGGALQHVFMDYGTLELSVPVKIGPTTTNAMLIKSILNI